MKIYKLILFSVLWSGGLLCNQDKIAGAVIVSAVGDALGRVTEFIDTSIKIQQKYGSSGISSFADLKPHEIIDGKALYTDDTLMAKMLLEETVKAQQNNLSDDLLIGNFALRCSQLFGKQSMFVDPYCHYRAHGPTNISAGQRLEWLYEAQQAAKKEAEEKKEHKEIDSRWWQHSLATPSIYHPEIAAEGGCGSVMRAWPLGLVYGHDIDHLCLLADKQSQLTHRHPMARASSCAIAVGVAHALKGAPVEKIVQAMVDVAEQFDDEEKNTNHRQLKLIKTV